MSQRKPYLSDLSDARWALIEPKLTAWRMIHIASIDNLAKRITDESTPT